MEITDFQDVSKIKGIIFDLDGVLVDTRPLHYVCLNKALKEIDPKFEITLEEHHDRYDGLSTNVKLEMLTSEKQLPRALHRQIWRRKQEFTAEAADEVIHVDDKLVAMFKELKRRGYLLYCASNAIWDTIRRMLQNKGVLPYVDYFVSNEDVRFGKPNPEMYYKCLMRMGLAPCQVAILEDSPVGREAALMCGAHLIPIETPADVTLERIERGIAKVEAQARLMLSHRIISREPVTVLLPCAGPEPPDGTPKFLRDVHGLPMIKLVVENLGFRGLHIFVVRQEHLDKYNLGQLLPTIASSNGTAKVVALPGILEGAALSALAAREHIDPERPLIVANPDQYMLWDPGNFLDTMMAKGVDGGLSTFNPDPRHSRFSYCEADKDGWAIRVHDDPEQPGLGTTGVYFFRRGADFLKYTEEMVAKNLRTRGLFYVHNVFNVMIDAGLKIKTLPLEEVLSTGIHDVEDFMRMKEISKMTFMGQGWRRAVKL